MYVGFPMSICEIFHHCFECILRCNTGKNVSLRRTPTKIVLLKSRLHDLEAVVDIFLAFGQLFDIYYHDYKVSFYHTKHDPKMDCSPSEASLSHQRPPQNLTILEVNNHKQDVKNVAQLEIEMVNLPR